MEIPRKSQEGGGAFTLFFILDPMFSTESVSILLRDYSGNEEFTSLKYTSWETRIKYY